MAETFSAVSRPAAGEPFPNQDGTKTLGVPFMFNPGRTIFRIFFSCTLVLFSLCSRLPALTQGETPASPAADAALAKRIDPKAQALLDKTIQALGGEAFRNFKTLSTQGRFFAISEGSTTGFAPFRSDMEFPDKRRFTYGKDPAVVLINNGDRGWELDRYGLIRQETEQVRRWKITSRYNLLGLLRNVVQEPGVMVLDAGVDFVDLLPVHVLEVFDQHHMAVKLYLQRTSYLPVRITYRLQDPQSKEWDVFAESYSDYKEFQGIQTPLHWTRFQNDERVMEYFLNSAEYNDEFPPNFFQPHR